MLYGRPTKFIRHNVDEKHIIEPQRYSIIPIWYTATGSDVQYQDAEDVKHNKVALGSRITKSRVSQTLHPHDLDKPTNWYWGRLMLSFDDVYSPYINGNGVPKFANNRDTSATWDKTGINSYINIKPANKDVVNVDNLANQAASIQDIKNDDYFKHFVRLSRKMVLFDQRYVFGDRYMRVAGKVKRGNPGMLFALWIYNDAERGNTPDDTAIEYHLEHYFEEWAI